MAIDARAFRSRGATPRGLRAAVVSLAIASCLLFGCASVRSAGDRISGWFGGQDEAAPAPVQPPAAKTAVTTKKKRPAAAQPAATPERVGTEAPVEAPEEEAAEPYPPGDETQAPERSIFDPY